MTNTTRASIRPFAWRLIGVFKCCRWSPRNYIGRLNINSSADANFKPAANASVYVLAVSPMAG